MKDQNKDTFNNLFNDFLVPMMKIQAESYRAGMKAQEEIDRKGKNESDGQ